VWFRITAFDVMDVVGADGGHTEFSGKFEQVAINKSAAEISEHRVGMHLPALQMIEKQTVIGTEVML